MITPSETEGLPGRRNIMGLDRKRKKNRRRGNHLSFLSVILVKAETFKEKQPVWAKQNYVDL